MGAIGMTYEQAGHGMAGLGIDTREGYELTLVDRVEHHHTTGISTIEVAARNVERLNTEFSRFFKDQDQEYKSFVVNGEPDKIAALENCWTGTRSITAMLLPEQLKVLIIIPTPIAGLPLQRILW
jgi:hypothetical protein